ncbi:MAG: hypothetical protein LUG46_06900, partial [Erysipelotrichaceae bacterium]|nr:hypothetical protein [Erysipelotrichaceae bacterium]
MKVRKILSVLIIILLAGVLAFLTLYHYVGYDWIFGDGEVIDEEAAEDEIVESDAKIFCIGDSQTVMNNGYPSKLEDLVDLKIKTYGGKELTSRDIAARLNAYSLYVKEVIIPEDTSPVTLQLYNSNGSISTLLQSNSSSIPSCSIDGIEGTIEYENGIYTFTRSSEGEEKTIDSLTRIQFTKLDISEDDIVIFLMGNYDDEDEYFVENLITFYNNIIKEYDIKNY